MIIRKSNWVVVSQAPEPDVEVATDSTVELGVRKASDADPAPGASDAPRDTRDTSPSAQEAALGELRSYLRDNFGQPGYETPWYQFIVDLRPIGQSGVDVVTSIHPDNDAREPAEGICHAVSGFIFRNGQTVLTGLRVSAPSGHRLVLRMSLSDDCAYDG